MTDEPLEILIIESSAIDADLLATIEHTRLTHPLAPVMVVAREAAPDDVVDALDAGADDVVQATMEAAEFLARIRNLLRRRRPPAT